MYYYLVYKIHDYAEIKNKIQQLLEPTQVNGKPEPTQLTQTEIITKLEEWLNEDIQPPTRHLYPKQVQPMLDVLVMEKWITKLEIPNKKGNKKKITYSQRESPPKFPNHPLETKEDYVNILYEIFVMQFREELGTTIFTILKNETLLHDSITSRRPVIKENLELALKIISNKFSSEDCLYIFEALLNKFPFILPEFDSTLDGTLKSLNEESRPE